MTNELSFNLDDKFHFNLVQSINFKVQSINFIYGSVKVPQRHKIRTQQDFLKNFRYTNLLTNVMWKTFRSLK